MRKTFIQIAAVSAFLLTGCNYPEEKVLINYQLGELEIFLDSVEASLKLEEEPHWSQIEDRFSSTVLEIEQESDSLNAETIAHLRDLELRLNNLKQSEISANGIEAQKEKSTQSIIDQLEKIASMNSVAWETVSDSYSDNLIWIEKNSIYMSQKSRKRIDSLTKIIENKYRSK